MRSLLATISISILSLAVAATDSPPSTCCFPQLLDFEGTDLATPLDAAIGSKRETKGISINSFAISTKYSGANVTPDPRGTYYAYYGTTTAAGGSGIPYFTVNYDGSSYKAFSISKLFSGCSVLANVANVQFRCNITMAAKVNGINPVGSDSFVFDTQPGTQPSLVQYTVDTSKFSTLAWEAVDFRTTVSVNLPVVGFVSLEKAEEILKIPLPVATFVDSVSMAISPRTCAACPA